MSEQEETVVVSSGGSRISKEKLRGGVKVGEVGGFEMYLQSLFLQGCGTMNCLYQKVRSDGGEYKETNPNTTMGLPLGATIGWTKNGKVTKKRGEEIEGKVEGGAGRRGREPRGAQNKSG